MKYWDKLSNNPKNTKLKDPLNIKLSTVYEPRTYRTKGSCP